MFYCQVFCELDIHYFKRRAELGTLEWINSNPDFLILISIVETFHFSPNPLFFPLLGYPLIVFSNENISVLSLVVCFSLIGCCSFSDDYSFSSTFKIILQDYVNLENIKKRGSSINPDIHHSKVFSSVDIANKMASSGSGVEFRIWFWELGPLSREKIAKIVFYHQVRANGWGN